VLSSGRSTGVVDTNRQEAAMSRPLPTLAALLLLAAPALAEPVPAPAGATRVLTLGADGVQVYACTARAEGHAWVFQGPEAALFDAEGRQVGTHGAGPYWRLEAGGRVTAEVAANAPAAGTIPWLLLRVKDREGEGALPGTSFIRRIDTVGGLPPREPCDAARAGTVARMRYSAVYEFWRE
jgi:hypothetical protein